MADRASFLTNPLCGPAELAPSRFWGPEEFDAAAWREFADRLETEREIAALVSALTGSRRILDVGCGTGLLTQALAARFGGCTAVDPVPANIAHLQGGAASGLDVVRATAEQLPFGAAQFDAVISTWVLQYAVDPEKAVAEMARVCTRTPGSRVLIVQAAPWNQIVRMYNLCAGWFGLPPAHHGFLLASAAQILQESGFEGIDFSIVPAMMRFPEPTTGEQAVAAVRIGPSIQFGRRDIPAELRNALLDLTGEFFRETPQRLNDDGVLLSARKL